MKFVDKLGKNSYVIWDCSDFNGNGWKVFFGVIAVYGIGYLLLLFVGWLCRLFL